MRKCWAVAAGLALATSASAALVPVVEYRMQDGANNGWYNDNGYSGTGHGGYLTGGTGQLTDGSKGNPILSGYAYSQPYLFWANFSPEIIFDLGSVKTIGYIRTYFLIHNQSATYLPNQVNIAFSNDGSVYGPTLSRIFTTEEKNPGGVYNIEIDYQLLPSEQTGRYVKLTYVRDPSHQWMAFDEVEFSSVVPEPAALSLLLMPAMMMLRRRRDCQC